MAKFPDLNKDGKVTQADILMGRGVKLAKGGRIVYKEKGEQIGGNPTKGVSSQGARTFEANQKAKAEFEKEMAKEEAARLKEKGGEVD